MVREFTEDDPGLAFETLGHGYYADRIATLISRPLFSETRRRPEPKIIEEIKEIPDIQTVVVEEFIIQEIQPDPPSLKLRGIMRSEADAKALIAVSGGISNNWFAVGDVIEGWRISSITETIVSIERDGFVHNVELTR